MKDSNESQLDEILNKEFERMLKQMFNKIKQKMNKLLQRDNKQLTELKNQYKI